MGNIQVDEAEKLRRDWDGSPCRHPQFCKEYYLGAHTGDFVCTTCGEVFSENSYDILIKQRKEK